MLTTFNTFRIRAHSFSALIFVVFTFISNLSLYNWWYITWWQPYPVPIVTIYVSTLNYIYTCILCLWTHGIWSYWNCTHNIVIVKDICNRVILTLGWLISRISIVDVLQNLYNIIFEIIWSTSPIAYHLFSYPICKIFI